MTSQIAENTKQLIYGRFGIQKFLCSLIMNINLDLGNFQDSK